jgi:hypothetical protein
MPDDIEKSDPPDENAEKPPTPETTALTPSDSPAERDPLAGFPQWARILNLYKWPIAAMFGCVILLAGYIIMLKAAKDTARSVGDGVQNVIDSVKDVALKFNTGYITETFTSAIPELNSSGMNLELTSMQVTETIYRSDAKNTLWDSVYLGTTTTEIRVPVTYRYYLDLVGPWELDVSGQNCIVKAPAFKPTLPPAIHTQRLQKRSDRGWARFNESQQMSELERNITPTINRYAADFRHRDLVREACRKKVAEFVRDWLLKEDQWRTDRFHSIRVVFADEADHQPEQYAPTIRIKEPLPGQ